MIDDKLKRFLAILWLRWVIVILAVLGLFSAIILVWATIYVFVSAPKGSLVEDSLDRPVSVASKNDDSEVKVYMNLLYKYKLLYPSNAEISTSEQTVGTGEYVRFAAESNSPDRIEIRNFEKVGHFSVAIEAVKLAQGSNLKSFIEKENNIVGDILVAGSGPYDTGVDRKIDKFEDVSSEYGVEAFRLVTATPEGEFFDIDVFYIRLSSDLVLKVSQSSPSGVGELQRRAFEEIAGSVEIIKDWAMYQDGEYDLSFEYPGEARVHKESKNEWRIISPYPLLVSDTNYSYDANLKLVENVQLGFESFIDENIKSSEGFDLSGGEEKRAVGVISGYPSIQVQIIETKVSSHYTGLPTLNRTYVDLGNGRILVMYGGTFANYEDSLFVVKKLHETLRFE